MATVAQAQTYMDSAITAREADDYDGAIKNAELALGASGGVPLRTRDSGGSEIEWDPKSIQAFIDSVRMSQAASVQKARGGLQRTKVTYAEATG